MKTLFAVLSIVLVAGYAPVNADEDAFAAKEDIFAVEPAPVMFLSGGQETMTSEAESSTVSNPSAQLPGIDSYKGDLPPSEPIAQTQTAIAW